MSKICVLTGKKSVIGNRVSKSNIKTKRKFNINLHKKRFYIPEKSIWIKLKVSSSAIKNINKIGVFNYICKIGKKHLLNNKK